MLGCHWAKLNYHTPYVAHLYFTTCMHVLCVFHCPVVFLMIQSIASTPGIIASCQISYFIIHGNK